MPVIEGLDPTVQTIGTFLFMAAVAIFSAYHYVYGKKPAKPETKEFAVAGQLADMGPVKELVETSGLLFQQQIKTNMHLEATATAINSTAAAINRLCAAYEAKIEEERRDQEIAEEVARQLKEKR